eukprot:10034333-Karenia_brevis.AAC.1
MKAYRDKYAPSWLLEEVRRKTRDDGTMCSADLALYTRALMPSLAPKVDSPPSEATFEWVKRPVESVAQVSGYIDGSRLNADHTLYGLCARQGWAIAAFDKEDKLAAAAHGRTPLWAAGIHATELWGLLMAAQTFDPGCSLKVDFQPVQKGSQRDRAWAMAPNRKFARAWGPVASALEGDTKRVIWMPAHCNPNNIEHRKLSDGSPLTAAD